MMKFYAKVLKYIFTNVSLIIPVVKQTFVQKNIVHPTKFSNFFYSSVLALLLLMVGVGSASATAYTWNGSKSTDWANTLNWTPNGNPGSAVGDVVQIGVGTFGTYQPTLSVSPANPLASITLGTAKNATLTISAAYTTGLLTIGAGSTVTESGTIAPVFTGGVTNNGTFTASTGVHTFSTNNQALSGTLSIPSITVTGIILTNNNTLTVATALSGTGSLTQAANATLTIGGTSSITTLTATNTGNTVIYNNTNQTVNPTNYYNLTLSGWGTDYLQLGTTTISGTFTNNVTTTAVTSMSIGNVLLTGGVFNAGSYTLNVSGNWTNNNGAGAFVPQTGTVNFTGNSSSINGSTASQTFNNIIVAETAGQTLSYGGSTTSVTLNGDFTLTSGTFAPGANLIVAGNWNNNGGTFTPGTGTVTMNGSGKYIQGSVATAFNGLTIGTGNSINIFLGIDQTTVNGTLTLNNGLLRLGTYNLVLGASSPAVAGTFNNTSMIVADGSGQVRKLFSSATSYTFPIGDSSSPTNYYAPITLNFSSGTFSAGAYVGVNETNAKHPQNTSTTNYLTRYWSVSQSGISAFLCTVTGTPNYGNDVVGGNNLQSAGEYTNSAWTVFPNSILSTNGNTVNADGVTSFGDFTSVGFPTITPSTVSLTGFNYVVGSGPSAQQSFTLTGIDLTNNITVTPPADYEISTTSNSGFQSTPITFTQSGGIVNSQTIYVRLKAGLAIGNYAENIVFSSTGAIAQNVTLSGAVTYCTSSGSKYYGISYVEFNSIKNTSAYNTGYSDYTGISTNVAVGTTYPLTVTVNTGGGYTYNVRAWIDWDHDGVFQSSEQFSLGSTTGGGNVSTSIIVPTGAFVGTTRMRIIAEWNGNTTSPGPCDPSGFYGEVEDYTVNLLKITTGVITGSPFNTGDAVAVPFTTNGSFTAGNVFTAQLSNASGSFTSPVTLGTLTATGSGTINGIIPTNTPAGAGYRIRVIGSTPAVTGTDNGVNITIIAGASITRSVTALSGFSYMVGNGPSAEQSFTVGGTSLTAPIIVTPPADFEVSVLSGGMFYSSTSSPTNTISLTPVGGVVSATIYVRLKAGLSVSAYGPENITLSSTSFTSKTVSCIGSVLPSITAGTSGSYCSGESINLTSTIDASALSYYWEGPNNFYSQAPNPTISSAAAANTGTYTITATYADPTATNLVANGDFETGTPAGNDLTQYQYMPTTSNALQSMNGTHGSTAGEGNYAVCYLPHDVHSGFSTNPPKGGKYQMVVNGSTVTSDIVWGQTINNITSNTSYQFSYWEQSAVAGTPSKLKLYANGSPAVSVYTAPSATNTWQQYTYTWNSGSSTSVTLTLQDAENSSGGNDFAIDNIVFQRVSANSASVNVTVNTTNAAASVTIAASPGSTVNAGTNVTFTATALNAGHPPTYQWYNGSTAISGATSSTYSFIPTGGEVITCKIISTSACPVNTTPISSTAITMVVNSTINYWLGGTSTDWGTAANWTAGNIPGTGDNIVFSTTSTSYGDAKRDLFLDADRTIGSLTNQSTKALVIPPAKCLTVNGKIITNGVSSPGSIYIQAYPDGTQQNGSLIFPNETTNKVYGTVEMYSKAHSIAAPGIQYPAGTGKYYRYSWQYFGIPVNTIYADPTFYGSYVRKWDETGTNASNHWIQLGNSDQLNPFIGYEITQDVTAGKLIVFQGQLMNGNATFQNLARTSNAAFPGQHIFANPYTAAIDIKKFISHLGSDTDGSVYLYSTGSYADWGNNGQGATNGTSAGQYQVVTSTSGIGIPTQIPSMQAVLVQIKTGSLAGASSVTFNYSDVVKNNDLQRVKGVADDNSSSSSMVYTMIDVAGSQFNDRMWIFTDSTFTKKFDWGWDGNKMLGIAVAPQLYAIESDGQYQINCVNDMNNTVLGFQRGVDTQYTFTFTHENTRNRYAGIYLQDSVENKIVDITTSGSQYTFTVDSTGVYQSRFKIITRNIDPNTTDIASKLKVFNSNGIFYVQNMSDENGEFGLFDMTGRQLYITKFGPNTVSEVCKISYQGVYVARARISSEKVTKRVIVE